MKTVVGVMLLRAAQKLLPEWRVELAPQIKPFETRYYLGTSTTTNGGFHGYTLKTGPDA